MARAPLGAQARISLDLARVGVGCGSMRPQQQCWTTKGEVGSWLGYISKGLGTPRQRDKQNDLVPSLLRSLRCGKIGRDRKSNTKCASSAEEVIDLGGTNAQRGI